MVGGAAIEVVGACIAGTARTAQTIVAGQVLSGVANAGCVCVRRAPETRFED